MPRGPRLDAPGVLHHLARSMRSLLTGYAGAVNRRSRRRGPVFQNRYKSVVCDEAVYCLALVRSLPLKPLRARLVAALEGVAKYAYSGQVALVGTRAYGWQDTEAVLTQFGRTRLRARREYLRLVAAGVKQGRRVALQGGGLIGSAEGWQAVQELRRGRERYAGDERILGSREFVEQVRILAKDKVETPGRFGNRNRGVTGSLSAHESR